MYHAEIGRAGRPIQCCSRHMVSGRAYESPDGILRFVVTTEYDGDVALGFDGFAWHTHADLLAALAGTTTYEAVNQFVQDLLGNRSVIAILRVGGEIKDVWISDAPNSESGYLSEGESIELRHWNGQRWTGTEPVSGHDNPESAR